MEEEEYANSGEGWRGSGRKEGQHRALRMSMVLLGARANYHGTRGPEVAALRRYETRH